MSHKSILELKILWYLNNIEDFIDKEALSIIKLSHFDDNGKLQIYSIDDTRELYDAYWKNLNKRLESALEKKDSE